MEYSAEWIRIDGDRKKYVHRWNTDQECRGTICIIHGLGEHGGRYQSLASRFTSAGFMVCAFDQQGHGLSNESRGCIESYESMLDDICAFISWARSQQSGPVILFGHSMGGNLVLNYAMRREEQPNGVISSSPMIRVVNPPSWVSERFARLLLMIAPNFRLKSRVVAERLMDDPAEQVALMQDDLFHCELSLRLGGALLDSGRWALDNAQQLKSQTLLTHGTEDYRTCHHASKEFSERANSQVCRLVLFEDRLHDPFRDIQREAVIQTFVQFASQAGREGNQFDY